MSLTPPIQPFAPARPALRLTAERTWSQAEMTAYARRLWSLWASEGQLEQASLAAIPAQTTPHAIVSMLALMQLGVPFVPVHPAWGPIQRRAVLDATGATPLSTRPPPAAGHDADEARNRLTRSVGPRTPLAVVFTSGSTGEPKGAILSHGSFAHLARVTHETFRLGTAEVFHLSLTPAHVGGLAILVRAAIFGGHLVLPLAGDGGRAFAAEAFVQRCAATETTVVSLVPTQLRRICSARLRAPKGVKLVFVGGAPAPPSLLQAARELGWPVHRTYGLTEACSQVATDRAPESSGPIELLPHVEARLGPDGRLALRGPSLFSGYWGQAPRQPDEWFVTSDLATLGDGCITPLGRADDVIITGGENVHPEEVDAALASAPGVSMACSFGRESLEWGQELCAAVIAAPDFDARRLIAHLRAALPSFKIPKAWLLVSQLPTTPTGKISRRLCQQAYSTDCRPLE